jgi:hypothetical protein
VFRGQPGLLRRLRFQVQSPAFKHQSRQKHELDERPAVEVEPERT